MSSCSLLSMMNRYEILVRVIDQLRFEAPKEYRSYFPKEEDPEKLNHARSKAYIHLLLKVYFGLVKFEDRHDFITDGPQDGGIDAYFVDDVKKVIFFVQSKFRHTEKNFEEKSIHAEELLAMDIPRILDGEESSAQEVSYNDKIQAMARKIRSIPDIGRYRYQVVILANVSKITRQKTTQLTGGFPAEIIDFNRCYSELLFPLISGTFYKADELQLNLNLSDKNAGSKISYSVSTRFTDCEITVVFVPTIEIARTMDKYRNSLLKFNPRSYLEHEGQNVNESIRSSIEELRTNEFALYNNGITVLSDETFLNEKIGQKDRAQLVLVNPQIINGGQTAYTLSRIFSKNSGGEVDTLFSGKEVLLKVITFDSDKGLNDREKAKLINSISSATNKQSVVSYADRRANEPSFERLQKSLFEKTGLILERKKGEFGDGVREGYLKKEQVVDRNDFIRVMYATNGMVKEGAKKRLMKKFSFSSSICNENLFEAYRIGVSLVRQLRKQSNRSLTKFQTKILVQMLAGCYLVSELKDASNESIVKTAKCIKCMWLQYENQTKSNPSYKSYIRIRKQKETFNWSDFSSTSEFKISVLEFFRPHIETE